jgi:membrane fusion protein (multidrug efflux system)
VALALGLSTFAGCSGKPADGGRSQGQRAERTRSGGDEGSDRRRTDEIAVRIGEATRESMSEVYETSTTVRAQRTATITARTRGRLRELLVEEGEKVREDAPVARLEDEEQRIEVESLETTAEATRREFERLRELYDRELVSENEFEAARREADVAKHALELARLELTRTVVRAPFDGVIVTRHLDVGATVSDGTPIYDIADVDPLEADVRVPEDRALTMRVGGLVELTHGASGQTVDARVERIAPAVDPETGTVKVTVSVPTSGALRPGAFARVEILGETRSKALVVPRRALVAEGSRFRVFRVADDEDGAFAEEVPVEPGFEREDRVEIRRVLAGHDLDAGDPVVIVGAPALSDGSRVTIVGDELDVPAESPSEESAVEASRQSSDDGSSRRAARQASRRG